MSDQDIPDNAPITAFEKARIRWFENYGAAIVENRRLFFIAVAQAIAILGLGGAIFFMMPLKTVVPYTVKVNQESGQVTVAPVGMQRYMPGDPEKQYFLAQWATKLMTLDKFMTERYLTDSYILTRDKAVSEIQDWIDHNRPIEAITKDPSLTRTVTIRSVSFIQDGAALVRATLETRSVNQKAADRKNVLVTIHYAVIPPKTEKEILENPIGLFVTHFAINEDLT